jgi:hypothetical protein
MEGQWTYSNKSHKWANESFATKEEAILHGSSNFDQFYIGQLYQAGHLEYMVDNIEQIV